MARIHVMGAAGSGTTTLATVLAARLGVPHEDSDRYFWLPTDPPYMTPRPPEERVRLLLPRLCGAAWVHSGATIGWGEALWPLYDLVIVLSLDHALRMRRLEAREVARFGERVAPGGDMHRGSQEFLDWAALYETAGTETRSRAQHEAWLAGRTCPVLRLDSAVPVERLVDRVLAAL